MILLNSEERHLEKLIYRAIDHLAECPGPALSEDITWFIYARKLLYIPDESMQNHIERLKYVRHKVMLLLAKLREAELIFFKDGWERIKSKPGSDGEFTW